MQIPQHQFGNALARPAPLADIPRGDPIGDAGQRVSQIAGNVVDDMAAQDRKREEEQRRAQAALALAKTSNAMHDAHDEVSRGVQDGTIELGKATSELSTRVGKVRDEALSGYADPAQRDTMEAHLVGTEGSLQRNLGAVVLKRQQHNTAASIDNFGEEMGRFAMRDGPAQAVSRYASFVRNAAPSAGLDEKAAGTLIQKFTEKTHADFFSNAATAALTTGNVEALRQLRGQIAGPEGEAMDPQRRATLSHTIFGWEQSILARQDRLANSAAEDARKRHNEAVDIFNKGTEIAIAGGYLAPDFIKQLVETAAGTEMAPRVQNLIASQRVVAGFATQPADQRAARLERFRAERANPQVGVDPLDEKLLNALTTMDDKLRRQAEENPWEAAQAAGVIERAPVLNLADPVTAVQTIQQRMQQIATVEAWTGKRASPLQPQEVEQLSKFVRQLPIDQAGTLLAGVGEALGNSERVAALGQQLHDTDGTLGLAMMYANAGTTQGRKTAELVLRGEQALKDKSARIDPAVETGWRSTIAKEVRGAYSNREVEDRLVDAAFKIAAARYAEGSGADLETAIKLATGGIIERNGQRVPLPYGMSERDFDKRLSSLNAGDLEEQARDGLVYVGRTPMSLDQFISSLPKATLMHAGQGLYNVRAGAGVVTNAQGKRISIKVAP
jgi:hypothetical protein